MSRPTDPADEYRAKIKAGLAANDWQEVYAWTKGWVGQGGGAWVPEAWLTYAASALLHGQSRIAVRSLDLGLQNWISNAADRSILLWARGAVIHHHLADPKTALPDLEAAAQFAPDWLAGRLVEDTAACRASAATSRKRKPCVQPAPEKGGDLTVHEKVAGPPAKHKVGSQPHLWNELLPLLEHGSPQSASASAS